MRVDKDVYCAALSLNVTTVEGELGVAGSLLNFFKDCGVGLLWLVWLCSYMYHGGTEAESAAYPNWFPAYLVHKSSALPSPVPSFILFFQSARAGAFVSATIIALQLTLHSIF